MSPSAEFVELLGRGRLSYVEQGDPAGVPVVLLHGVTDSWFSFEPVLPHLPDSLHAFALSQRGHGDSDRPPSGYGPLDFADDVAAFLDAFGLAQPVVVGHSMGATVAQRFALAHPGRTRGLVLVASFVGWRGNPEVVGFWESAVSSLTDPIDPAFARAFQESTLARPVPPEFLDAVVGESLRVPARVWRAVFQSFLEDDFSADLGKITAPTLIVWGDRDGFVGRKDQEALTAAIPGSRLLEYAGTGHAVHWEEPGRFARDLAEFIGGLGG